MKTLILALGLLASIAARAEAVKCPAPVTEFTVRLHFASQQAVLDKCNALHAWPDAVPRAPRGHALGCNAFHPDSKVLEIWTPMPEDRDDAATENLGHEVLHGACGEYHG